MASSVKTPPWVINNVLRTNEEWISAADYTLPARLYRKFWGRGDLASFLQPITLPQVDDMGTKTDEQLSPLQYLNFTDCDVYPVPKFIVRPEYVAIYDYLDSFGEDVKSKCAILTGQPGIGKSIWIYYAIARRLTEEKPFFWWYLGSNYLFTKDGVFIEGNRRDVEWYITPWALADSKTNRDGIPRPLIQPGAPYFPVYSTSPVKDRWAKVHKVMEEIILVMNPWSRREIHAAGHLLRPNLPLDDSLYDVYGPIPRICIDYGQDPDAFPDYCKSLKEELSNLNLRTLETLTRQSGLLSMNSVSEKLCLIVRPPGPRVQCHVPDVYPITATIGSRIALQLLRTAEWDQMLEAYNTFLRSQGGMIGSIFEAYCHRVFQRKITLRYQLMVRSATPNSDVQKWYCTHQPFNGPLEEIRLEALRQHRPTYLSIYPSSVQEYMSIDLAEIKPNVYYIPAATNEVTLDSFILHSNVLYIFQFAAGRQYRIKSGVLKSLKNYEGEYKFILVLPEPSERVFCPTVEGYGLQFLQPYSAVVSVIQ